ncbi:MAG: transporter substrate-binding domain-containing protein, partial [Anaerovorax sp.]
MKKNKIIAYIFLAFFLFYFYSIPSYATDAAVDSGEESLAYTLSSEELQYLQDKKLKVSLISDWKPFSYSDENGAYHGLPMMILQRLSDVSGLTLEIIPAKNYEQSLEQLSTGKVDMMGMMSRYPAAQIENSEAAPLKMLPYLETQTMLIYHKNTNLSDLSQVTLADIRGRFQFTKKQNMSPFYYDSPDDCITAVRCKQADVMVCDIFTGSVRMQEYETKDLESIPSTLLMEFGFGIVPKGDSRLLSSLEKTIASFSTEDINRSLLQGISYGEEGFLEIVYRYPFEIICFMVAIMFVITLCLITYTKINIHQHQALQGYEESYRLLADTFGEAGIEYDYLNDSLTVFGKRSNLDVAPKVEDFKQNLENQTIRILLTVEQLERILKEGVDNQSFVAEFQCGIKSGEWIWYRLIYTVVCTTESHRRPIRLVGCLTNIEKEHAEKEQLMK